MIVMSEILENNLIKKQYDNGDIRYFNNKYNLHRTSGPAVIKTSGETYWYKNGKPHRMNGPAINEKNYIFWYKNGNFHCISGPALEHIDGDKEWCVDGKLHRLDGPAQQSDNTVTWCYYGQNINIDANEKIVL